jgi:hypothetical protein
MRCGVQGDRVVVVVGVGKVRNKRGYYKKILLFFFLCVDGRGTVLCVVVREREEGGKPSVRASVVRGEAK